MREPMRITWTADAIYNQACDRAHGSVTADELYHVGYSLMLLGLNKLDQEEREVALNVLPAAIDNTLDALDGLQQRRKLNGHAKPGNGGLAA